MRLSLMVFLALSPYPNDEQIEIARAKQQRFNAFADILKQQAFGIAKTKDDQEVLVFGNIETPNEAKNVMSRGGNGIGLYRSEFLLSGALVSQPKKSISRPTPHLNLLVIDQLRSGP